MDILGKKAKIPDPKVNLAKIGADYTKADKELKARFMRKMSSSLSSTSRIARSVAIGSISALPKSEPKGGSFSRL